MPSASTQPAPALTSSTSRNSRTSRRRRSPRARSRNRFEVPFASATGPAPRLSCALSACVFAICGLLVEELPAHGIALAGDVALREHDLEQVRVAPRRAEHLRAAVQVHAPDAPEALVELLRVERADALPIAVEPFAPGIQRQRVVPAQVLDVHH